MQSSTNFLIEGGHSLSGSVETSRSKNGAVALLAAALLNHGRTALTNMPKIEEVNRLIEVLESLGVSVTWQGSSVTIQPPAELAFENINAEAASKTRSIILFIGSIIHASTN